MKGEWTLDRHVIWAAIARHRWWVAIYVLLNVLDSLSTYIGLQQGATEMNPLALYLISVSFPVSTAAKFGVALLAVVISAIVNHRRMFILKLMTLGLAVAVWFNLLAILRYTVWGIEHQTGKADLGSFAVFIAIITGVSLAVYVVARLTARYVARRRCRLSGGSGQ